MGKTDWERNGIERYQAVYTMLEDGESRFIYLNRLNFLVSGDIHFIHAIVEKYHPDLGVPQYETIGNLLASMPKDRKFVLFGASFQGRDVLPYFKDDPRFIGFCSSTKRKQESGFLGYPVISPEKLFAEKDFSVVISAPFFKNEILGMLSDADYPSDLIFTLDSSFEISSDEDKRYFGPEFITFENEEVFVDAGCYDLQTSIKLRDKYNRVKKIYAFEPDPENYKLCLRNKEEYHMPEAEILPYGAWSERTTLHFERGSIHNSHISEEGGTSIEATAIDEVVDPNERVTFIKMDIEGSELEALKGAKQTILRDKPKLAICLYHKPEDMTEIPLYIKSLVPEYKIYIRHHSNSYIDTVLYAVMPQ